MELLGTRRSREAFRNAPTPPLKTPPTASPLPQRPEQAQRSACSLEPNPRGIRAAPGAPLPVPGTPPTPFTPAPQPQSLRAATQRPLTSPNAPPASSAWPQPRARASAAPPLPPTGPGKLPRAARPHPPRHSATPPSPRPASPPVTWLPPGADWAVARPRRGAGDGLRGAGGSWRGGACALPQPLVCRLAVIVWLVFYSESGWSSCLRAGLFASSSVLKWVA